MSSRELYDWYEFYNDEPFFTDRIEMQLATISLMISSYGGSSKGNKPTHDDFMIRRKEKPIISQEEKNKQLISAFESL